MYFLYNLALGLSAILTLPFLLLRARAKGQTWDSLPERLGVLPPSFHQTRAGAVWLHAVSVGEVLSCAQLFEGLRARFPNFQIFVSTSTVTGQKLAREKLGRKVDGIFYAPLDFPFAVNRVFRTLRPRLVVIAETEIWPNLFKQCRRYGAGLLIVNGRISDKSAPRYRRWSFFFRRVFGYVDAILAQSERDRERFIEAGADSGMVSVGGNLKYDFRPSAATLPRDLKAWLSQLGAGPVIVAGSTRENEEQPTLEGFRQVAARYPRALLILAPRHPQRFDEAARTIAASGLPFVRRSRLPAPVALPAVLLLDSLGELSGLYPFADAVFVGGSLNGWGGHNVLEPALHGKPVVVGRFMQNFQAIADELLRAGGMRQIESAEELGLALLDLIEDPARASELARRGQLVAESQRGATQRAVEQAARLYRLAVPRFPPNWVEYMALWIPSKIWKAAAIIRRKLYERRWLASGRLDAFTLCVGNLTAGGVGKTPAVLWLVEQLRRLGHSPGVLMRGYRRVSPEAQTVIPPGGIISALRSGDEGQIMLRHFRERDLPTPLGLGPDRWAVGRRLVAEYPVDIVLLDDGYQHFRLQRNLDLVLIDVTMPFGRGDMIPLGRLREPLDGLARASAFLLTRTEPGEPYEGLVQRLRQFNPSAPVFRSRTRMAGLVDTATGERAGFDALGGIPTVAFCGVGNPESFWRGIEMRGVNVVHRMRYRDHHLYSPGDIRNILFAAEQYGAAAIVTTEKDLVNLWHAAGDTREFESDLDRLAASLFDPLRLYWVRIENEVDEPAALLDWIERQLAGAQQLSPLAAKVSV